MYPINYEFAKNIIQLRGEPGDGKEARLAVLMMLWGYGNRRGRSWVSNPTIQHKTGYDRNTVRAALNFLQERGAIYNVPEQYRIEEELIGSHVYVWQLTGVILLDGEWVEYLRFNDSSEITHSINEAQRMGVNTPLLDYEGGEILTGEGVKCSPPVQFEGGEILTPKNKNSDYKNNIASADKSTDASGSRYARRPSVVGTTEDSQSPAKKDVSTLPAYTQLMLMVTKSKWEKISDSMRHDINATMKAWDDTEKRYIDAKSAPEMYDEDKVYAAWVQEIIVPELRKHTGGRISKTKFLEHTRNYIRYQKEMHSDYGKAFAQRIKLGIGAPTEQNNDEPPPTTIVDIPGMD